MRGALWWNRTAASWSRTMPYAKQGSEGRAINPGGALIGPILDIRGALARLDGDDDLYVDRLDLYREDSARLLDQLNAAVAASDANEIKMAAHALKGLVA